MNTLIPAWKNLIQIGLAEDAIAFDWTARAAKLARKEKVATATLIAKSNGIWAGDTGLKALELISAEMGMPIQVTSFVKDGDALAPKQKVCEWKGDADSILVFERTLINLTGYASGIATQTHELVTIANSKGLKHPPRITGTRKTLPSYKDLAVQSTLIGGAYPHRYNLSGGLLIKENHVAAAGGITAAIENARKVAPHLLKIEIEVRDLKELNEAMTAGAEVIMLDNFSPDLVREAVKLKKPGVIYEVSGGIHRGNIESYLIEGLDVISVGSITHSVKSTDLSLLMMGA